MSPPLRALSRLRVAFLLAAWFAFSLLLSLFNKHLLGRHRGAFPAPLLMTAVQFAFQGAVIAALLAGPFAELAPAPLPRPVWVRTVLPVGVVAAGDIGASNASLFFISLPFYTLCKSSSALFLLFFAVLLGQERGSWRLTGSVALICAGVGCAVKGETSFDAPGLMLVLFASALSGLRWTLAQRLMARDPQGAHPLALLHRLLPAQAGACFLASLLFDPLAGLGGSEYFATPAAVCATLLKIAGAGCLALAMATSEFALLRATGAVTIGVAGTVKEAVSVVVFAAVDGDPLRPLSLAGLALVICGVGAYNHARHVAEAERRAAAAEEAAQEEVLDKVMTGRPEGAEDAPEESYTTIVNALLTNKAR